jgi:predicted Rdx family selenoprotein
VPSVAVAAGRQSWMGLSWTTMAVALVATAALGTSAADLPDTITAKGEAVVLHVHAEGAQIYECRADGGGRTAWQFREPIASLFRDGKTVGRHYAGPTWEIEGSAVVGRAVDRAPGATAKDIPWLKLEVVDKHGNGPLKEITTVQRVNTTGGNLEGACENAGGFHAEPYAADYIFLKRTSP